MRSSWLSRILLAAGLVVPLAVPLMAMDLYGGARVAAAGDAGGAPSGKTVFLDQKCNMCHSLDALGIERTSKSEKMAGPDLSTVGKKHDAAWIAKFIEKEETLDGKEHKKEFKGSDEELQALVDWLASLDS